MLDPHEQAHTDTVARKDRALDHQWPPGAQRHYCQIVHHLIAVGGLSLSVRCKRSVYFPRHNGAGFSAKV